MLSRLHDKFLADARWLFYKRQFEPEVRKCLRNLHGNLAVDVGAQIGFYTVMFSRNFKRVVAIEPNPVNVQNLILLVSYNGLANVEVVSAAAGNEQGKTMLNIPDSNRYGGASIVGQGQRVIEVRQVRLDDLLAAEQIVDLIKIDVEGGEFLVLEGAHEVLNKTRHLMVELHDLALRDELERILSQYSMRLKWLKARDGTFQHLFAYQEST